MSGVIALFLDTKEGKGGGDLDMYRVPSLIRKCPPHETPIWPQAELCCRVLGEGVFL